jgi:hypothetical protein
LSIDLRENLDRYLLVGHRGADDADELSFVHVAGDQQVVDEAHGGEELTGHVYGPMRALPQPVAPFERGLFNPDGRDAILRPRLPIRGRGFLELIGGLLHLRHRTRRVRLPTTDGISEFVGCVREAIPKCHGLSTERVDGPTGPGHECPEQ